MVTPKISKPITRERAARHRTREPAPPQVTATRRRTRQHALAPAHLGEAASAAVLAEAVLGLAVFIAGVAMAVSGMTIASRFGGSPPPNVDELGTGQIVGGIGLSALGLVLAGSALAVLAEVPRSRPVAAAAAGLAAILSAAGVIAVQAQPGGDVVLSVALVICTLIFGVAAVILVRPRG